AGLDVLEAEEEGASPDYPLLQLSNVIVTAHSAYYSEQAMAKAKERIYEATASIVWGEWPDWVVNPEVKENFQRRWKQPSEKFRA
ncbi:MAG: hypothetical protein ACFFBD_02690, partial [Candidatus Hodarchaeota archaeon]